MRVTPKYGRPGYETRAATGSVCGINDLNDLNELALINQLDAQYVLDSISTATAIGQGIATPGRELRR